MALMKPAPTYEGVCADLRSAISNETKITIIFDKIREVPIKIILEGIIQGADDGPEGIHSRSATRELQNGNTQRHRRVEILPLKPIKISLYCEGIDYWPETDPIDEMEQLMAEIEMENQGKFENFFTEFSILNGAVNVFTIK
ncbi:hypothetical protein K3495_g3602 [Podosphaera aphanis]|nr:hypothetical protein K3495_g3602 [Podosphaera aphanis]